MTTKSRLLAMIAATTAVLGVILIRWRAPVRPSVERGSAAAAPVAPTGSVNPPGRMAPTATVHLIDGFPVRGCWAPMDPAGCIGRFEWLLVPRSIDELLSGLHISPEAARRVGERVERAIVETRTLRTTPDAAGITWDRVVDSSNQPEEVGPRLLTFRFQAIPGSSETYDAQQVRIVESLREVIRAEAGADASSKIDELFLHPLVHQESELHWYHWHLSKRW